MELCQTSTFSFTPYKTEIFDFEFTFKAVMSRCHSLVVIFVGCPAGEH